MSDEVRVNLFAYGNLQYRGILDVICDTWEDKNILSYKTILKGYTLKEFPNTSEPYAIAAERKVVLGRLWLNLTPDAVRKLDEHIGGEADPGRYSLCLFERIKVRVSFQGGGGNHYEVPSFFYQLSSFSHRWLDDNHNLMEVFS